MLEKEKFAYLYIGKQNSLSDYRHFIVWAKKLWKKSRPLSFVSIHFIIKLKWWLLDRAFQDWPSKLQKTSLCNKMLILYFFSLWVHFFKVEFSFCLTFGTQILRQYSAMHNLIFNKKFLKRYFFSILDKSFSKLKRYFPTNEVANK